MSAVMNAPLGLSAPRRRMFDAAGWSGVVAAVMCVAVLAPLSNLVLPAGSALHLSGFMVSLIGKIMCYAICALAMDLIWGYTGILSLGHGLFFALGGYGMGMYLMRQIGRDGSYHADLPDFMVFLDWKTMPWHWAVRWPAKNCSRPTSPHCCAACSGKIRCACSMRSIRVFNAVARAKRSAAC